MRTPLTIAALTALALAGGCGSDGDSADSAEKASKPAGGPPPKELLGSYTTTLTPGDVPSNPPPELTSGSKSWKLTISRAGGPGGAPAFTIANAQLGPLESSSLRVKGDRLLLREVCAAGGNARFHRNEYSYRLSGKRLTLREVKNRCPDDVALTILTSHPWAKGS
jgi:hypothetical protein